MKILIFSVLLALSTLMANSTFAGSIEHRDLKKELDFEIKLTNMALEIGQEITDELEGKRILQSNSDPMDLSDREIVDILQEKAGKYAKAYDEFYSGKYKANYEKGSFQKIVDQINWYEVFLTTKDHMKNSMGIIKMYGVGYVVAFVVGSALEYASYYFMAILDLKLILSVAVFIPYGKSLLLLPVKFHEFIHRKRMIQVLGGEDKYNAFLAHRNSVKMRLNLTNPKKILFPLIQDLEKESLKVASITNSSFISKSLKTARRIMGVEVKGLDYYNLTKFLEKNMITNEAFDYLIDSPLPSYMKTGLISQLLLESSNSEVRASFLAEFNNHIVDLKPTADKEAVRNWVKQMLDKPSVERIRNLMANLPPGVDHKMAAKAWEDFFLPHYSREFNIGYFKYRRLLKEMDVFKDTVLSDPLFNQEEFFSLFDRHFTKALKLNLNRCQEPEGAVLKLLLRGVN